MYANICAQPSALINHKGLTLMMYSGKLYERTQKRNRSAFAIVIRNIVASFSSHE